jgi:FixJ family two-component response regulator
MKGASRKATGGGPKPDGEAPVVAIVDDDASVRQSMLRLVRSFGYRAEAFGSGEEFLGSPLAAEAACVLLDVRMPSMDGLDVQRRLAEMAAAIPDRVPHRPGHGR